MPRRTTSAAGAAHRAADPAHDPRRRRRRRSRRLPRHRPHRPLRQDPLPAPGRRVPGAVRHGRRARRASPRAVARGADLHRPCLRPRRGRADDRLRPPRRRRPGRARGRPRRGRATRCCCSVPGGAYAPDPTADWHLLVGDESALPAIGAALERVPAGVPVHALVEVDGPADEQELTTPGRLDLRWCHRDAGSARAARRRAGRAAVPGRPRARVRPRRGRRRARAAPAPARRARRAARRPVGVGLLAPRRRRGGVPGLQGGRAAATRREGYDGAGGVPGPRPAARTRCVPVAHGPRTTRRLSVRADTMGYRASAARSS